MECRFRPRPPRRSRRKSNRCMHIGVDCSCAVAAIPAPVGGCRFEACRCVSCSSPKPPRVGNRCSLLALVGATWERSPDQTDSMVDSHGPLNQPGEMHACDCCDPRSADKSASEWKPGIFGKPQQLHEGARRGRYASRPARR